MDKKGSRSSKIPGRIVTLKFPITASLILGIIAAFTIWFFAAFPSHRETCKFGIEAVTLAAGVLSAYYVGQGLRQTVVQRDQGLKDAQIAIACKFMERWNEPSMAHIKNEFRAIIESGKAHDANYVEHQLLNNQTAKIVVVEVLNFFEESALVANMGLADDVTLKRYFVGALTSYHSTLEPWIKAHRASKARPEMWTEIDHMISRWKSMN